MNKKGFTIIEVIVSAFLLISLLTVATPLLYQLLRYERDSNNFDDLNDNVQYVLSILEKELSTASDIQNITNGISFINQQDKRVNYTIAGDVLTKTIGFDTDGDGLVDSPAQETIVINNVSEFTVQSIALVGDQYIDSDYNGAPDTSADGGKKHLITVFLQAQAVENANVTPGTILPIQMSVIPKNQDLR